MNKRLKHKRKRLYKLQPKNMIKENQEQKPQETELEPVPVIEDKPVEEPEEKKEESIEDNWVGKHSMAGVSH